jgi:cytochrome c biogenesis protein CcmG/thiol:disulfide interchange protein DsbE
MDTMDRPDDGGAPVVVRRRRMAPWIAGAVGVVILMLVIVLATRKPVADRDQESPLVGQAVPALVGTALDGSSYNIDTQRGKWVLVNFFASWCGPCQAEHPELRKFDDEHRAAGDASIVSVPFQNTEEDIRAFFSTNGGSWPVLATAPPEAVFDFGIVKLPESYLVAPSGQVVAKFNGGVEAGRVDDLIKQFSAAGAGS